MLTKILPKLYFEVLKLLVVNGKYPLILPRLEIFYKYFMTNHSNLFIYASYLEVSAILDVCYWEVSQYNLTVLISVCSSFYEHTSLHSGGTII